MQRGLATFLAGTMVTLVGCGPDRDEPQRLVAHAELVASDGATPVAGAAVDRYQLTFLLTGEAGPVEIERSFFRDRAGDAIVADQSGRFEVSSDDLALSYDWQRDEEVCDNVCIAWDTVCHEVSEEICASTCAEEQCWDECWDACTSECWDETECDEYGDCWTVTVCDEDCVETCEPVCETVAYPCDCYWDSYEVCDDECAESALECGWVTRSYTSYPALDAVEATRSDVWIGGASGAPKVIAGDVIEAHQQRSCDAENRCENLNLWVQKDRFTVPADD